MKSKDIVARVGPSQRAKNMQRMLKGSTYTTFPPIVTSSSFDFRTYFKNIFAQEPFLKLATFVVAEVIYQNKKKKVTKIIPCHCNHRRQKRGQKNRDFFQNRYFSHIKFKKNMFMVFLHSTTSNDNLKKQNQIFSSILSTENNL